MEFNSTAFLKIMNISSKGNAPVGFDLQHLFPQGFPNPFGENSNPFLHSILDSNKPKVFTLPKYGDMINHGNRRFIIGKELSEKGAFGRVYECTDEWSNKLVAKILRPSGTHDEIKSRWERERANLIELRHPNITYLQDAFEYNDTFYLIIEQCNCTLGDLIKLEGFNGQFWIKPIARCLLQALQFIHDAQYVHKDLHPGNIFVHNVHNIPDEMNPSSASATVFKIGDFGISNLAPNINPFNTYLAQWMLPPEYIDPESFGIAGKSIDIYHAGLLFLSILLGHIPVFNKQEILDGIPRRMAESLPSPYAQVIAKALRRHVHQRTQSARDFWEEMTLAC